MMVAVATSWRRSWRGDSGDIFEQDMMHNRAFGPYGWIFWALMLLNVLILYVLLWSRRDPDQPRRPVFLSRCPSTLACGWNALSSSSRASNVISFRHAGTCIIRRGLGTGRRCSAAWDSF